MSDDRQDVPAALDLSALDPTAEPDRMNALVASIVRDGLEARRTPVRLGPVRQVGAWATPVLAAAGLVLAVSIPAILTTGRVAGAPKDLTTTVAVDTVSTASRFGLPATIVALASGDRSPTPIEIVTAFDSKWHRATQ